MTGFHIINLDTDKCIHEETGFDVENTQDMYDDVHRWWDEVDNGALDPEKLLVKLFVGYSPEELSGEEEELRLDQLL